MISFQDLIEQFSSPRVSEIDFTDLESQYKLTETKREECSDCEYTGKVEFQLISTQHVRPICVATFVAYYCGGNLEEINLLSIDNSLALEFFRSKCMDIVGQYYASKTLELLK